MIMFKSKRKVVISYANHSTICSLQKDGEGRLYFWHDNKVFILVDHTKARRLGFDSSDFEVDYIPLNFKTTELFIVGS